MSISDTVCQYDYLPYRYGHPGDRYGRWGNDMGDDSIDTVISHIDMGYLVTLATSARPSATDLDAAAVIMASHGKGRFTAGPYYTCRP